MPCQLSRPPPAPRSAWALPVLALMLLAAPVYADAPVSLAAPGATLGVSSTARALDFKGGRAPQAGLADWRFRPADHAWPARSSVHRECPPCLRRRWNEAVQRNRI
jgi:hypothetical protein